jgi:hypothetical protein
LKPLDVPLGCLDFAARKRMMAAFLVAEDEGVRHHVVVARQKNSENGPFCPKLRELFRLRNNRLATLEFF